MSTHITPTEFLKSATTIAEHFNFQPVDTLKQTAEVRACKRPLKHTASAHDRKRDALHGLLTNGLNAYCQDRLYALDRPVFFYSTEQVPRSGDTALSLQIYGVDSSIAESILIHTLRSLVSDLGFANYNVRINSLGDRDSVNRYIRELTNFFRRRINDMPSSSRELMKDHVYTALSHLIEVEHELAHRSPNPMEYLSDFSRKHFREIVEYLDLSETTYEIDPLLIGHHECYSDAIFAIDLNDESDAPHEPLHIRGGRYSEFTHRYLTDPVPAAGAVVVLRDKKIPARIPRPKLATPSIYVIQLGFGPKMRTVMLIDELRQAGITVYHDLASNSLSEQLRHAEKIGVDHVVIVGQKEFVENSAILRDMSERTQEIVDARSLPHKLGVRKRAVARV